MNTHRKKKILFLCVLEGCTALLKSLATGQNKETEK
jgi:hypothetical protein